MEIFTSAHDRTDFIRILLFFSFFPFLFLFLFLFFFFSFLFVPFVRLLAVKGMKFSPCEQFQLVDVSASLLITSACICLLGRVVSRDIFHLRRTYSEREVRVRRCESRRNKQIDFDGILLEDKPKYMITVYWLFWSWNYTRSRCLCVLIILRRRLIAVHGNIRCSIIHRFSSFIESFVLNHRESSRRIESSLW